MKVQRGEEVGLQLYSFFHFGASWGWMVNAKPRPLYPYQTDQVPEVLEAGWVPGPVWWVWSHLVLTAIRSPDRPGRSQEYGHNRNSLHNIQQGHAPSRLMKLYILNL